jgi:hypothetical protein
MFEGKIQSIQAPPLKQKQRQWPRKHVMLKIDATQLAFQFSLRPWGSLLIKPRRIRLFPVGSPLAMAMTSSSIKKPLKSCLGLPIDFSRNARTMPFTMRLVWPTSNGYNAQPTELNIARPVISVIPGSNANPRRVGYSELGRGWSKSRVLRGSFICIDKSGRFCQLGFSNHSGRWQDFQSKIRLSVKTERTQHCMMWHA